jgi:hypothetical protein
MSDETLQTLLQHMLAATEKETKTDQQGAISSGLGLVLSKEATVGNAEGIH